jgi:hypothetical protein
MPYTSSAIYSESFWWHAPYWTFLLYSLVALVVIFHFTGRLGVIGNILTAAGAKGQHCYSLCWRHTLRAVATSVDSVKELVWKMLSAVIVGCFLLFTGCFSFIRGVFAYTLLLS